MTPDTAPTHAFDPIIRGGDAFGRVDGLRFDMARLIDLYMAGKLKLDELVSRRYPLEGINDAFDAMRAGEVARSVITF
jgi:Zn-dependent alcohol dehydrogenase